MSYLEMSSAPLPDMSSGIISIWFREIEKQALPPDAEIWPQGFWTKKNADIVMVPPNAQYSIGYDPDFMNISVLYDNPYGRPVGGPFGDLLLGCASVWIPNSPPIPNNTNSPVGSPLAGTVADTDMSKFGIRTLLTFGDPNIDYKYATWRAEYPDVIPWVEYLPQIAPGPQGPGVPEWPKPYKPYWTHKPFAPGVQYGQDGKFKVTYYATNSPVAKFKVPPSFIGIDNDGHIVINLQTNTKATYKGMAFTIDKVEELWAAATYLQIAEPYTYTEIGFPFPDGYWISIDGFWNGFQFTYKDISQDVMGCAPESFVIYAANVGILDLALDAPTVKDGGWHHLLFSFDISGSVTTDQTSTDKPIVQTTCKAWLAFDGKNITDQNLQNRPPVHDGFLLPQLRGTETTSILACGPTAAYSRIGGTLGPNDILPRNAWLHGWGGNPKDGGLTWFDAHAQIITDGDDYTNATARLWGGVVGDFNWMDWTGLIWPLYGHGVAPGPWQATFKPMHPTTPDPTTSLSAPSYKCSGFSIPCNGNPIGVPAGSAMLKNNTGVEVAELQIWANQSIDTGNADMVRLFIDYLKKQDQDGNTVPDTSKGLRPVPPKIAEKALGRPHILVHGSGNWKKGINSGSTGRNKDGTSNLAGQFQHVGGIEKFKPEPQLDK
jgi:hypothetical protein